MNEKLMGNQLLFGGICGILGTASYILIVSTGFSPPLTFTLAMTWPVLSIIYSYILFRYIDSVRPGIANHLAFLFACIAFTMVALMLAIQIILKAGIDQQAEGLGELAVRELTELKYTLRWIDLGIDLAWDVFLGVSMICLSLAITRVRGFRLYWSVPAMLLGISVIVLNLITLPDPPNTKGIPDIGPFLGVFVTLLAVRVLLLGLKLRGGRV
jgi:hypothetical protein